MGQYTPRSDAFRRDGTRVEGTGSAGWALSDRGTLVLSGMLSHRQRTDRAGPDPRDQIVPGDADRIEKGPDGINRIVEKRNAVPQPNHLIGHGETFNSGLFFNANTTLGQDGLTEGYAFGGYSRRRDHSSGFYRRGIDNRSWPEIHPLGFLPSFRGDNKDFMVVTGMRGSLGVDWTYGLSAQWNRNVLDTDIYNTLNVSLGPCLQTACAPGPWAPPSGRTRRWTSGGPTSASTPTWNPTPRSASAWRGPTSTGFRAPNLNSSTNYYGLQAFRLQEGGTEPVICRGSNSKVRCLGYNTPGATGSVFLDNGPHFVFAAEAS